jgi:hypothetical protein
VNAQTITIRSSDGASLSAGRIATTRIQVQMNISHRVTIDGVAEQLSEEEAVRRFALRDGDERMHRHCHCLGRDAESASLNVNSNAQERNETLYSINGNATGTCELTPQQQDKTKFP